MHVFVTMESNSNDGMMMPVHNAAPATATTINCVNEIEVEIVGLYCGGNGRSCCSHKICGEHVKVGDLPRLVPTVVEVEGVVEEAIKFVRVLDGVDCCNVGFVPRVQATLKSVKDAVDSFVIVVELYSLSENKYKKIRKYS